MRMSQGSHCDLLLLTNSKKTGFCHMKVLVDTHKLKCRTIPLGVYVQHICHFTFGLQRAEIRNCKMLVSKILETLMHLVQESLN